MSDKKTNNPQAFPPSGHRRGMTMRQWYKSQALSGIDVTALKVGDGDRLKKICGLAADLMIEEDGQYKAKEEAEHHKPEGRPN